MSLENTYKTLIKRTFLIESLPESIKPSDSHLQIFDNYIENTRIRLRKIREPETKNWTRVLEQVYSFEKGNYSKLKISQMFLTDVEYKTLEIFKGREIRKNRYYYELNKNRFELDIFLGKLWGLNIATIYFDSEDQLNKFELPKFSKLEITNEKFFIGRYLVDKSFADVQREIGGKL